ncbi:MAG: hypothetical protein AAGA50_31500 [Pseudomonadota bacterium]
MLSLSWAFAYFLTNVAVGLKIVAPVPHAVALIYIPHGIQLLAAWAYGWRSVLYLLPIVTLVTCGHDDIWEHALTEIAVIWIFDLISAPLGIHAIRHIIANEQRFARLRLNWRVLVLGGLLATILNSGVMQMVHQPAYTLPGVLGGFLWLVVSDMAGLMVVLLSLMFLFRWARLLFHAQLRSS